MLDTVTSGIALTLGGALILASGIATLFDVRGLGTRFIAHAGRTARFSWQRRANPNNAFVTYPVFNRIALGAVMIAIGALWLADALARLLA